MVRWWFKRRGPSRPAPKRFADLQAMAPAERQAAFTGAHSAGWVAAAARYGLVEAQLLHGQALLDRDPALALRWFRAAAGAGYTPAVNMVGRCFERGWGTGRDLGEAARCYRQSAEQGFDWAQFNLANLLLYGLGVPRDRVEAFAWFRRAANQGHAKAMNMLGRFHEEGWDRPRSLNLAVHWYSRAAAGGDYRGQFNLGTVLAQGSRHAEALAWFERALAAGDRDFVADAARALAGHAHPPFRALGARASAAPGPATRRCQAPAPFEKGCAG